MNKQSDDVPVMGCTPAEAIILHVLHQNMNGGKTFEFKDDKGALRFVPATITQALTDGKPRTHSQELRRLTAKYGHNVNKQAQKIVTLLWPNKMNPSLPEKFADLNWREITYDGLEVASLNYATGAPVASAAALVGAPTK